MSPSAVVTISANAGDFVCRPTGWIDVVKFFLLNYGLHAFTTVSRPGNTTFPMMVNVLAALVLPFSSIATAFDMIRRFPLGQSGALKTAHKAGALCMILPEHLNSRLHPISSQITEVHGQYPLHDSKPSFFKSMGGLFRRLFGIYRKSEKRSEYQLVFVSSLLTVEPLGEVESDSLNLACNYSFIKAAAAISQILYATFELYEARGRQLEKFGYAAYSLTVIPYILMSLTNLLATACTPQYPSMFIVLYRGTKGPGRGVQGQKPKTCEEGPEQITNQKMGQVQAAPEQQKDTGAMKISSIVTVDGEKGMPRQGMWTPAGWPKDFEQSIIGGAIGEAYGQLEPDPDGILDIVSQYHPAAAGPGSGLALKHAYWMMNKYQAYIRGATTKTRLWHIFLCLAFICAVAAPYVTIYFLTGFRYGQSSGSQRGWIMTWLVIGQFYGITITVVPALLPFFDSVLVHWLKLSYTLLLSVVTVGGFVIVARMILEDEICTLV